MCSTEHTRKNLGLNPQLSILYPAFNYSKEFLVSSFSQWTKTCPIQSELFYNNQAGHIMPNNQD